MTEPIPTLEIQPCDCGLNCGGVMFIIGNPQIADDGRCYAVLPAVHVRDLVEDILRISTEGHR